jgi:molecular chaperone GrpE
MTIEDKPEDKPIPEAANDDDAPAMESDSEAQIDEIGDSPWSEGETAELRGEIAELKDRLLRTLAETENLRRRAEREREETRKYAVTVFARDMIGVGDNLTRAVQSLDAAVREAADDGVKTLIDGVEMTHREMLSVFERHGITRLSPEGERFDPNFHQAMFEVENLDVASGTVIQVVQEGYVIGERVLRPAMVGVSKGGPKAAPKSEAPDAGGHDAQAGAPSGSDDGASGDAEAAAKLHEDAANASAGDASGKTIDRNA